MVNNTSLNNPIKQIGEIEIEEEYDENDEENNCEKVLFILLLNNFINWNIILI